MRPAWLAVAALLVLTWTPTFHLGIGYGPRNDSETPLFCWTAFGLMVLGALIARAGDRWAGAAVTYLAGLAIVVKFDFALMTALWFGLGVGALTLLRTLPAHASAAIRMGLLASAALMVAYMLPQRFQVDPIWFGWVATDRVLPYWPTGTFGNPRYAGVMFAVVLPLVPWSKPTWTRPGALLLPWLALGLALSGSYLAVAAAALGLGIAAPRRTGRAAGRIVPMTCAGALIAGLVVAAWTRGNALVPSLEIRARTLALAERDLWGAPAKLNDTPLPWLWGRGGGGWASHVPLQQLEARGTELFNQAHCEPYQWRYEAGLPGLALLVGWVRSTWRQLRPAPASWHGAVAAAALAACGLHVLHVPGLAPVLILVLGGALLAARVATPSLTLERSTP